MSNKATKGARSCFLPISFVEQVLILYRILEQKTCDILAITTNFSLSFSSSRMIKSEIINPLLFMILSHKTKTYACMEIN